MLLNILTQPWPWYVAGPLIGLIVPALLLLGGRSFGISGTLRHVCAAIFPANISFFKYNWKSEAWSLVFVGGIILGAWLAISFLANPLPVAIHPDLRAELAGYGITNLNSLIPVDVMNWNNLFSAKGLILLCLGGFLVGFGTRYAGGCTSGHSIMGLSNLQWPSLVATCCFMIGGFTMASLILPFILAL